jgi:hypothetical protein
MGQVRWAGWTMAIATALVMSGGQVVRADIASDKPAAIVIYPKVAVDTTAGVDTVIRLTNTNQKDPIQVHCFYLDANSHCSDDADICQTAATCGAGAACVPGWQETDFWGILTPNQPIEWKAGDGLADLALPLPTGVCLNNPFILCGSGSDCSRMNAGSICTLSNAGTRIPPVPEDPFTGELRCIAYEPDNSSKPDRGKPTSRNDLKGEALVEHSVTTDLDVASYNAIGIQATGAPIAGPELTLGGAAAEYNGCPKYLILDHFFDDAKDPVPGSSNSITTNLVLVPCSDDLLRQIPGATVVQYLVYNEFEQRFSTSNTVDCFQDIQICKIGSPNCTRSIFNVAVAGTLTGQTRMQAIGVSQVNGRPRVPSGLLGVALEKHTGSSNVRTAAFHLQMRVGRDTSDTITIP